MFAVCMRYSNSRADAQDAFQEGFVKVFQKIKSYKGEQEVEGWIRRVMVNTCIDIHRKNKNLFVTEELDQIQDYEITKEEVKTSRYTADELVEHIQELPPQYRTVFNLYVMEEYSHAEIAEELCISVGTSKSNLSRAKSWLRNALTKETKLTAKDYTKHEG